MIRRLRTAPATLRLITVAAVAGAAALLVAAGVSGGPTHRNPLAGARFAVDPASVVAQAARAARTVDPASARRLQRIADVPMARWFGDWLDPTAVTGSVRQYVTLAARASRMPVLVLYDIPNRDCGAASRGGAADDAAYRGFVSAFARGLTSRPSVVVVEPDALAQLSCLPADARRARLALIHGAVETLRSHRGTHVYLDAGNSRFVAPSTIAASLRSAGVARAAGFALDVANFVGTAEETEYGRAVSRLVGGAHFVIDTSRNGNGAASGALAWCNPRGRALGHVPTTRTGDDLVDAWLWIKTPGQSDGACHAGDPPAGTFWTAYALGLAAGSS